MRNHPISTDLSLRLDRLERSNFRWRVAGLCALAALGAAWVQSRPASQSSAAPETIEAQRFVLRDRDGAVRAVLGIEPCIGAGLVPQPGLFLFNTDGQPVVGLGIRSYDFKSGRLDLPELLLVNPTAPAPRSLGADLRSEQLVDLTPFSARFWSQKGAIEIVPGNNGGPRVDVIDAAGRGRVAFGTRPDGTSYLRLDHPAPSLATQPVFADHPVLQVRPTVLIESSGEASPSLKLFDKDFNLRLSLGETGLSTNATGERIFTGPASMTFFDPNGDVLRRLP